MNDTCRTLTTTTDYWGTIDWRTPKALCRTCPLVSPCLEYALTTRQDYGVWGGTTERERRDLRRARRRAS
jgi:WhiB family redox-sensing transcriptional regulator